MDWFREIQLIANIAIYDINRWTTKNTIFTGPFVMHVYLFKIPLNERYYQPHQPTAEVHTCISINYLESSNAFIINAIHHHWSSSIKIPSGMRNYSTLAHIHKHTAAKMQFPNLNRLLPANCITWRINIQTKLHILYDSNDSFFNYNSNANHCIVQMYPINAAVDCSLTIP